MLIDENGTSDLLRVVDVGANCGGAPNFRFGSVNLAQDYVSADVTFTGNNNNQSTLVWSPTACTLTITLGSGNGQRTNVPASAPIYTAGRRAQGSRGQRDRDGAVHRACHIPVLNRLRSPSGSDVSTG